MQAFKLWIEAEVWEPGSWNAADANADVMVTFADGSQWVATFYTYANIHTLAAEHSRTGECLHGSYFWGSDMILIAELHRPQVEQVVSQLLEEGLFEHAFTRANPEGNSAPDGN